MLKKSASSTRRKGSERVKAWIYTVLNPLLETLPADNRLLSKKHITWRYITPEMEFILPTRELIQPSARPNYDDFLRGYPKVKPLLEDRDRKVETLFKAALDCWKHLTQQSLLQEIVKGQLKQWREEGNPYPGGAVPEDEFWLLIAEHIMNNAQDLPFHYSNKPFWSRFGQNLLAVRAGPTFTNLEKSILALIQSGKLLIDALDQARSSLCQAHDIPAAPI